ncbi:hypothetical protein [Flexivirga caeni]|uniref:Uncharacterized protein n=1 Tax=Flexivirga caeni TaxID=2294115 RepID=A0A3M9MHW2_9MICO|nr:hypothetical protein [Flexivirga caeni]RNI25152.1 hypothetical protein EFY87_00425 [Flexivirga caeni]
MKPKTVRVTFWLFGVAVALWVIGDVLSLVDLLNQQVSSYGEGSGSDYTAAATEVNAIGLVFFVVVCLIVLAVLALIGRMLARGSSAGRVTLFIVGGLFVLLGIARTVSLLSSGIVYALSGAALLAAAVAASHAPAVQWFQWKRSTLASPQPVPVQQPWSQQPGPTYGAPQPPPTGWSPQAYPGNAGWNPPQGSGRPLPPPPGHPQQDPRSDPRSGQ